MITTILLSIAAIIVFIGIIRIIFDTPSSFIDAIMQMFLLDWLFDILGAILNAIFDGGGSSGSWD